MFHRSASTYTIGSKEVKGLVSILIFLKQNYLLKIKIKDGQKGHEPMATESARPLSSCAEADEQTDRPNSQTCMYLAQWIRLRLPTCRPGFESQAHHLHFFLFQLEL